MNQSNYKRLVIAAIACLLWRAGSVFSADAPAEYLIGPADVVRITVFENPELASDVRVAESGTISFPLIGQVPLVGLTIPQAQAAIAQKLSDGHFVAHPQVTILPLDIVGSQVTVVGYVNKPGRYPLKTTNTRVSDALADAGGIETGGGEAVILIQHRDDREVRIALDINKLFVSGSQADPKVQGGDVVFVPRQSLFYVYGEVMKPGAYRLEPNMSVMQGLAVGGYSNERGSKSRTQIYRQAEDGSLKEVELDVTDLLKPNDVIYVRVRIL